MQLYKHHSNESNTNLIQIRMHLPVHFFAISRLLFPLWLCSCRLMYLTTATLRSAISRADRFDFFDTILITAFYEAIPTIALMCGQIVSFTIVLSSSFQSLLIAVSILSSITQRISNSSIRVE